MALWNQSSDETGIGHTTWVRHACVVPRLRLKRLSTCFSEAGLSGEQPASMPEPMEEDDEQEGRVGNHGLVKYIDFSALQKLSEC